ncbi:9830_t:CDS:2 [Paraglomus occultum]|uniref:9830_t:CDS:1 n=1 Tax=Paraglomus occultum TaxID=144539 RepID=A0A9N9AMW0_9GLOM|nr:9830_t:CDS:2 [Paraglomus occultum]
MSDVSLSDYKRFFINISTHVAVIHVKWPAYRSTHSDHIKQNHSLLNQWIMDEDKSPLLALFTPEWGASVIKYYKSLEKEGSLRRIMFHKTHDISKCLNCGERERVVVCGEREKRWTRKRKFPNCRVFHVNEDEFDFRLYVSGPAEHLEKYHPLDQLVAYFPFRKEIADDIFGFYSIERSSTHEQSYKLTRRKRTEMNGNMAMKLYRVVTFNGTSTYNTISAYNSPFNGNRLNAMGGLLLPTLPPELIIYILESLGREDMSDLIPTILVCARVNKWWCNIARKVWYNHLDLSSITQFTKLASSTGSMFSYINRLSVSITLLDWMLYNPFCQRTCHYTFESSVLSILQKSTNLQELKIYFKLPHSQLTYTYPFLMYNRMETCQVAGWEINTPHGKRNLIQDSLIRTFNNLTAQIESLDEREPTATKVIKLRKIGHDAPLKLLLFQPPSDALISAIRAYVHAFRDRHDRYYQQLFTAHVTNQHRTRFESQLDLGYFMVVWVVGHKDCFDRIDAWFKSTKQFSDWDKGIPVGFIGKNGMVKVVDDECGVSDNVVKLLGLRSSLLIGSYIYRRSQ